jgi:hypothetical protein
MSHGVGRASQEGQRLLLSSVVRVSKEVTF